MKFILDVLREMQGLRKYNIRDEKIENFGDITYRQFVIFNHGKPGGKEIVEKIEKEIGDLETVINFVKQKMNDEK
jgi:hypothetical protein